MNQDILKSYPDNHFDSIVTDPPYGIEFLGKDWDSNTGAVDTWEECYRVLKPGGHILAFSAARTYHKLATNIESVGFEIRDQLMWLYASGFPKAQDIGKAIQKRQGVEKSKPVEDNGRKRMADKLATTNNTNDPGFSGVDTVCTSPEAQQWSGWKTALKPSHEPIVMARKPFKGSCLDNVLKHSTGALNIDATRIAIEDDGWKSSSNGGKKLDKYGDASGYSDVLSMNDQGRFPSNVFGEIPDYQKYFYCPKVSRAERSIGCENLKQDYIETVAGSEGGKNGQWFCNKCNKSYNGSNDHTQCGDDKYWKESAVQGNNHPTVKPVALMSYLVKLVTPEGGKVLDPFSGSGSTGMACVEHGFDYTGCELDPAYVEIATKRIEAWDKHIQPDNNYNELFEDIK